MKNRKRNQKGFSLIESLIVVAIILIIAAIAIPNLLQACVAANEASAPPKAPRFTAIRLALPLLTTIPASRYHRSSRSGV